MAAIWSQEFVWEEGEPRILDHRLADLKARMNQLKHDSPEFQELLTKYHEWLTPEECPVPQEPTHPLSRECVLANEHMPDWYGNYLNGYATRELYTFEKDYCTVDSLVAIGKFNKSRNTSFVELDEIVVAPPHSDVAIGMRVRVDTWASSHLLGHFTTGSRFVFFCPRDKVEREPKSIFSRETFWRLGADKVGAIVTALESAFLIYPFSDPTYFPGLPALCVGRAVVVSWQEVRTRLMNRKGHYVDHRPRRFPLPQ